MAHPGLNGSWLLKCCPRIDVSFEMWTTLLETAPTDSLQWVPLSLGRKTIVPSPLSHSLTHTPLNACLKKKMHCLPKDEQGTDYRISTLNSNQSCCYFVTWHFYSGFAVCYLESVQWWWYSLLHSTWSAREPNKKTSFLDSRDLGSVPSCATGLMAWPWASHFVTLYPMIRSQDFRKPLNGFGSYVPLKWVFRSSPWLWR